MDAAQSVADEGRIEPVSDNECRVTGTLSLATVPALKEQGVEWLEHAAQQCRFDLAAARFEGSAGVALLIAWLRAAAQADKELIFVNAPEHLLRIARISGAEHVLNLVPANEG